VAERAFTLTSGNPAYSMSKAPGGVQGTRNNAHDCFPVSASLVSLMHCAICWRIIFMAVGTLFNRLLSSGTPSQFS
jgi:hypothetical protein